MIKSQKYGCRIYAANGFRLSPELRRADKDDLCL